MDGPANDDDWIDDVHIRAARELLRWDQSRLALAIGRHPSMVRRLETARKVPAGLLEEAIAGLRNAGVIFIPPAKVGERATLGGVLLAATNAMEPRKRYKVGLHQEVSPAPDSKKP